jgi:hypothetical protein
MPLVSKIDVPGRGNFDREIGLHRARDENPFSPPPDTSIMKPGYGDVNTGTETTR